MEYLQKALEWAYILACLALIWYGVSLVAALWRFARRQLPGRFVFKVLAKFMGAWVFAWGVVWIGILSASP